MNQLKVVWEGLNWSRRIWVIGATVAVFVALLMLARLANTPRLTLLYGGLDPSAAGEVVSILDQQGVAYDIRGASIFVDSRQRDQLRMTLAAEGKPSGGAQGYELLDNLTGFGTTSQMFDATYWRAKEGELTRTLTAQPHIADARVHISNPVRDPFSRRETASASVSITTQGGGAMSTKQIAAIRHLVAAAVAGLSPEEISVIDSRHGLLQDDSMPGNSEFSDARAELLRANALRLLEARVGPGNAIVEVTVDTVSERETISERIIDPDVRVAISSDTEETQRRANNQGNGAVTVASNLPDGAAGGNGQSSEQNDTTTREIINYDVSETQRELVREPGTVRRLSVAILVNGVETVGPDGQVEWQPRGSDELSDLRELVSSAVGFDQTRGDSVTIKSMQLDEPADLPPSVAPGLLERVNFDAMRSLQIAVMAAVALILGLFVVRPILAPAGGPVALAPPQRRENDFDFDDLPILEGNDLPDLPPFDDLQLPGPEGSTGSETGPADRLKSLIDARPTESVEVLSQWMKNNPENA